VRDAARLAFVHGLLVMIAAEIQAAIPGAEVRLFGSRARGNARPDRDQGAVIRFWRVA
jgi:predicted nucleotidyltransferase